MAGSALRWDMGTIHAYVVMVGLAGAAAAPGFWPPSHDGFPLSTYPMFSHGRKTSVATVHHVVGFSSDDRRQVIAPRFVANEEVMQAAMTVEHAIRRGPAASRRLCTAVAARVASGGGSDLADLVRLQVRSDRYDAVAYFAGGREPSRTRVAAECAVPRVAAVQG